MENVPSPVVTKKLVLTANSASKGSVQTTHVVVKTALKVRLVTLSPVSARRTALHVTLVTAVSTQPVKQTPALV